MSNVLVVDDEEAIRRVLVEFLQSHGFTASAAEDGTTALAMIRHLQPEVVLLDICMPGLDGIETLKRLKSESPRTAVIMISGETDLKAALESLDHGAYDFIQKPLDLRYLERTLIARIATLDRAPSKAPHQEVRHAAETGRGRRRSR